jgi:TetR/AcrR family transcriptional repressor of mexJK operon
MVETARRGRPVSPEKRAAILRAATDHFLRDGYEGTSLDAVAATAGVSKQTVYRHFTDKQTLFGAVVADVRSAQEQPWSADEPILSADDLHGSLVAFGDRLLTTITDARISALRRLIIGELGRRPELYERWIGTEPRRLATVLAAEVTELDATGVLDAPDAMTAVGHLIALLSHPAATQTRHGLDPLTPDSRRAIAESAATMFTRAYARRAPDA